MASMPPERRTKSAFTPVDCCCSSLSCWCVVLTGWIASDLASPILARWLNSSRLSINLRQACGLRGGCACRGLGCFDLSLSLSFTFSGFSGIPNEAYLIVEACGFFEEFVVGLGFSEDTLVLV